MTFVDRLVRTRLPLASVVLFTALFAAAPAFAYVGPGAGLTAIGSLVALLAAVGLAVVGFVWYPIKRLRRGRKNASRKTSDKPAEAEKAAG